MRARDASVRCVIGLTFTKACTQPGIVDGSTNTLLAKVSGKRIVMLICITLSAVCALRPSTIHIHDMAKQKTSSSPMAIGMPRKLPSARNPRTKPRASTTIDAAV